MYFQLYQSLNTFSNLQPYVSWLKIEKKQEGLRTEMFKYFIVIDLVLITEAY